MILSLAGIALQIVVTVTAPETLTVRQPATVTVRAAVRGPVAPMIRPPQFGPLGGVRVEDSVVVLADGCRPLTTTPKDLACLRSPPTT